ncbi:HPr family phosphocarrier protein [Streptomyces rubiginosohelvolus]
MHQQTVVMGSRSGLHARPASLFAEELAELLAQDLDTAA